MWIHFLGSLLVLFTIDLLHRAAAQNADSASRTKRLSSLSALGLGVGGYDTQSVLNSFKFKENSIIRTSDSIALGARYLNETSERSNYDCAILCFKTPTCNVAVFAEKSEGACYLFDCGSSENFLCKFTDHISYTVALLTTRSRHENELVSLRHYGHGHQEELPPTERGQTVSKTLAPPTTTTTTPPPTTTTPAPTTTTTTTTPKPESHCGEYQFKCANSSDCIAIYDVCNGIPQCSDGSDEAATLSCGREKELEKVKTVPLSDSQIYDIVRPVLQEKDEQLQATGYNRHPGVYDDTRRREYGQPYAGYRGPLGADYTDGVVNGRRYSGIYPQQQQQQQQQEYPKYDEQQAGYYYQNAGNSQRSFDGGSEYQTNYYPLYNREQYRSKYLNRQPVTSNQGEQQRDPPYALFGSPRYSPNSPAMSQQESEKQLQTAKQGPRSYPMIEKAPKTLIGDPIANDRPTYGYQVNEAVKPRRRPGKLLDEAPPPPPQETPPPVAKAPAPAAKPVPKVEKKSEEQSPPAKEMGPSMLLQVTQVETKTSSVGALFGLALGVCLSGLLVVLVGRRMSIVRRRLLRWRRGSKKGLSLLAPEDDEDYLVNGMYL